MIPDLKRKIWRAIHHPDQHVLRIVYEDAAGVRTRRLISPVKFTSPTTIRALCLCREQNRQFSLKHIRECELVKANTIMMPAEIEVLK